MKSIIIASTFSLQNFPESKEGITGSNHWVPQYLKIPVSSNFSENVKTNKVTTQNLIGTLMGSSKLIGMKAFIGSLLMLPFNLGKLNFRILSKKMTMTYSNMPAPKSRYNYGGVRCNSITAFLPAVGEMLCGIVACSHGNTMKFGLVTDT